MNISIFEKKKTISIYLASVFIRNYKSNNNESNFSKRKKHTASQKSLYLFVESNGGKESSGSKIDGCEERNKGDGGGNAPIVEVTRLSGML